MVTTIWMGTTALPMMSGRRVLKRSDTTNPFDCLRAVAAFCGLEPTPER